MPRPSPAIGAATRAQYPDSSSDSPWQIDLHTPQSIGVLIIQDQANHQTRLASPSRDHSSHRGTFGESGALVPESVFTSNEVK